MWTFDGTDPKQFISDFFTSFHDELLSTDEDPGLVVDRYHTPDILQVADGHRMDRDKLIAHTRPIRKNRPIGRMEVHDAIVNGDRIAARYTLHVQQRGKKLTIEVCFFGQFAEDGRMRGSHMLTRTASVDAQQPTSAAVEMKASSA